MSAKKSKSKSKEKKKKQKRKQLQECIDASLSKVRDAYTMGDLMSTLPAFRNFTRNGLNLSIAFYTIGQLPSQDLEWALKLLKSNMELCYIAAQWAWSDEMKRTQLCHDSSLFLVAREEKRPVGYINFRFELEANVEVVYCYEIQLEADVRRKGVGKFLVQILELIGHRTGMKKVMLTVFKENKASLDFFRIKMGYIVDEVSPDVCDPDNAVKYTYVILSKLLVKPDCSSLLCHKLHTEGDTSETSSR